MKNFNKINPEARVILSDSEMKEISGGNYVDDSFCMQIGVNQCIESACTKNGKAGICGVGLNGEGCRCITR